MQTFMPYSDYRQSVSVLDYKRLGKQRVETYQLLLQLLGVKVLDFDNRDWEPRESRWRNHPVLAMWSGHELSLLDYQRATVAEWFSRGYKNDTTLEKSEWLVGMYGGYLDNKEKPEWVDDSQIHLSHQSNLIRKDEEHYQQFFPEIEAGLPYIYTPSKFPLEERLRQNFDHTLYLKSINKK